MLVVNAQATCIRSSSCYSVCEAYTEDICAKSGAASAATCLLTHSLTQSLTPAPSPFSFCQHTSISIVSPRTASLHIVSACTNSPVQTSFAQTEQSSQQPDPTFVRLHGGAADNTINISSLLGICGNLAGQQKEASCLHIVLRGGHTVWMMLVG